MFHISWFQLWLLYNVKVGSMFKQCDPYLPSNHRWHTKEIHDIQISFSPWERLRESIWNSSDVNKFPWKNFRRIWLAITKCSTFAKFSLKFIYAKICAYIKRFAKYQMFPKTWGIIELKTFWSRLELFE